MGRFILLALVVAAGWYGWTHSDSLRSRGTHELVALNSSGGTIERVRISVGGETRVFEKIEAGATARSEWRCEHDGSFELVWTVPGRMGERHWTGGGYHPGPVLMRHRFEFTSDNDVIWMSETKSPLKR